MVSSDGTAGFDGDNVVGAILDKVVVWKGTSLPVLSANKVPQNGFFDLLDSLSAPTSVTRYIQTSATISSPAFVLLPETESGQEGDLLFPLNTTIADYTSPSAAVASSLTLTGSPSQTTQLTEGSAHVLNSTARIRFGMVLGASSVLIGDITTAVEFKILKFGSPTGTATVVVRDSGDSIVFTFGTIDVSTLTTTATFYDFENTTGHTLASGDRILIEYSGGDATNYIQISFTITNPFDTTNTYLSSYISDYSGDDTTQDLTFKLDIDTLAPASNTIDDKSNPTTLVAVTESEANPFYYYDMGSLQELASIAIHLDRTLTTVTTLIIDYSIDATFSGEQVRTMLVTDYTDDTFRFISIPRQAEDRQFFRIRSTDTGALAINEVAYLALSAAESARAKHYHLFLDSTDTDDNSEDSN